MTVHAATRAALIECSAVTAIWTTLVRITGEPSATVSGNKAHRIPQCATETVDAGKFVPALNKARQGTRRKQADGATFEQQLIECCLGALNVFMIDKRARQQLLAAQKKHDQFLSLLFDLASSDIWPNIGKVTASATGQGDHEVPFAEAAQSESGELTDAAKNQDPGDALCDTDRAVPSFPTYGPVPQTEAETADDLGHPTVSYTTPEIAEAGECNVGQGDTAGKASDDRSEHGHDVNNDCCIGMDTPDFSAGMRERQCTDLRISRLAAGVIATLVSRDANARRVCLERHGSVGICKLLRSSSACIQLHGVTSLGAFGADATHEQLVAFDAAFQDDMVVLLCSMLRQWTTQQLAGVDIIEEPECRTPVQHGLELVQAALLAVVEAKLAHSDPDSVFAVLAELMHLGYWCMGQGITANRTLVVCISNSAAVQFRLPWHSGRSACKCRSA